MDNFEKLPLKPVLVDYVSAQVRYAHAWDKAVEKYSKKETIIRNTTKEFQELLKNHNKVAKVISDIREEYEKQATNVASKKV